MNAKKGIGYSFVAAAILVAAVGWLVVRPTQQDSARRSGSIATEDDTPAPARLAQHAKPAQRSRQEPAESREAPADGVPLVASPPKPQPATLRVHVVSALDGRAVQAASIRLLHSDMQNPGASRGARAPDGEEAELDEDGWIEFAAWPGAVLHLGASAPEDWHFARLRVEPLDPGEYREVEFELHPASPFSFHGRVVRAADGAPIEGAVVTRTDAADATLSDSAGRFAIEARSTDRSMRRVEAAGFEPRFFTVFEGHETPARAFEVAMGLPGTLDVAVLGERDRPLPDWRVSASVRSWHLVDERHAKVAVAHELVEWTAATGHDGRASLADLPVEVPLDVEVRSAGRRIRVPGEVELARGEVRELVVRVGAGVLLKGTLSDQHGEPVADERLWLLPQSSSTCFYEGHMGAVFAQSATDSEGAFVFEDVTPGDWLVGPSPVSKILAPLGRKISVPAGVAEWSVTVDAVRDLFLEGRVLGPDGEPTSAARLFAHSFEGCSVYDVPDADGHFRLGPVHFGRHLLTVTSTAGDAAPEDLDAFPGEPVTVQLQPGGGLRVTAREVATGELRKATVSWSVPGSQKSPRKYGALGPERILEGLPPGSVDLVAYTADGLVGVLRDAPVRADAAFARVEVPLHPGGTLRVRCAGLPFSGELHVVQDGIRMAVLRPRRGEETTLTLAAGQARVELHSEPQRVSEEHSVQIRAGEETVLELDFDG